MSVANGIAGKRGKNPVGIFIHNDAGSQNANAAYYKGWLPSHLKSGFAHCYVASDATLQAEDDGNCAWHCGQSDGNKNYLSIEVCQSMGDLTVFKANEEKALALAAQKCKQYGITPNANTIKLHQEVYATACPHRSVEIHGGAAATKQYFINRIKELMNPSPQVPGSPANSMGLGYQVHSQGYGWLDPVRDGQTAGITGQSKRVEALKIDTRKISGLKLKVRAHIQGKGWVDYDYITDNTVIGSTGEGKRLEALEIIPEGLPTGKKFCMRAHFQKLGWCDWTTATQLGTVGLGLRIEAFQFKIV